MLRFKKATPIIVQARKSNLLFCHRQKIKRFLFLALDKDDRIFSLWMFFLQEESFFAKFSQNVDLL